MQTQQFFFYLSGCNWMPMTILFSNLKVLPLMAHYYDANGRKIANRPDSEMGKYEDREKSVTTRRDLKLRFGWMAFVMFQLVAFVWGECNVISIFCTVSFQSWYRIEFQRRKCIPSQRKVLQRRRRRTQKKKNNHRKPSSLQIHRHQLHFNFKSLFLSPYFWFTIQCISIKP